MRKAENLAWVLPRPKPDYYKGGFPLWFEERLLKLYGLDYKSHDLKDVVLQMFAGTTKYGFRVDINPDVHPDLVADCHALPEEWTNKFFLTITDPPYNDQLSEELYGTRHVRYQTYIKEAVRCTQENGYIASYHWVMTPNPEGTALHRRIFVGTRAWHHPRVCMVFKKLDAKTARRQELRRLLQS